MGLTDVEKYFFLLETSWIDVDWARIQGKFGNSIDLQLNGVFSTLGQYGSKKYLNTNDRLNKNGQTLKSIIYETRF